MKRIAIMQPYIFPYIGYFQLIKAVDLFVFYDDVNFIKKGWINRNRILVNGEEHLFTIPLENPSQNKLISETRIYKGEAKLSKLLTTIETSYSNAPYFKEVMPLVTSVFSKELTFISELAIESAKQFCEYLSIPTRLKNSSSQYHNEQLKKGDRLIDICHQEKITDYINASGGMTLYTKEYFKDKGITLSFIESKPIAYRQHDNAFVPWLSIIDVAMFNSKEKINEYLLNYEIV